jgi:aryl-alcohol dehydrogenase-like predicted oxidoreductase
MEKRRIGSLEVSIMGLGTNNFGSGHARADMDEDSAARVVGCALDLGINLFDTSDTYLTSEQRLGKALGRRREDAIILTKFGAPIGDESSGGCHPDYVVTAIERSLKMLGTDYVDIYQIHWPDSDTPIQDTLGALNELVVSGKVREIGCSNFTGELLRASEAVTPPSAARIACVQNEYNLLNRDDEFDAIPECLRMGLGYTPYFPLASGLLTGKYRRGVHPPSGTRMHRWGDAAGGSLTDANFDLIEALTEWANDRGHSILDLAISWLTSKPVTTSVICGATHADQVTANAAASEWRLSPNELAEVDAIGSKV